MKRLIALLAVLVTAAVALTGCVANGGYGYYADRHTFVGASYQAPVVPVYGPNYYRYDPATQGVIPQQGSPDWRDYIDPPCRFQSRRDWRRNR